jgi:putative flavoprotein involved in K+ transport
VPRRYRGRDIMWWLDAMGSFGRPTSTETDSCRLGSSLQLVGNPWREVDLPALLDRGVHPVGRLLAAGSRAFRFADDLAATSAAADARLRGLLDRIDRFAVHAGLHGVVEPPQRRTGSLPRLVGGVSRPIHGRRIRTVVWATGYRRHYPWLRVPVLDGTGEIIHHTPAPGLTVVGLGWHAGRAPAFISGLADEAVLAVGHVLDHLEERRCDPVPALPEAS